MYQWDRDKYLAGVRQKRGDDACRVLQQEMKRQEKQQSPGGSLSLF
jgi:hypothetical protein